MAFNAQVDQYKTIIDRNANATFNNYQIQSAVSGKRIYKGDAIYDFLNMADSTDEGESFASLKYNVLIVINEFLGDGATISYDLYVKGDPVEGTSTIADGKPTFTATV